MLKQFIKSIDWKFLSSFLLITIVGVLGTISLNHPVWKTIPLLIASFSGSFAFLHLINRMADALPISLFDSYRHKTHTFNGVMNTFFSFLWRIPAMTFIIHLWVYLPVTLWWRIPLALLLVWLGEFMFREIIYVIMLLLIRPSLDFDESDGADDEEEDLLWQATLMPSRALEFCRFYTIGGVTIILVAPLVSNPYLALILYSLATILMGILGYYFNGGIALSFFIYFDETLPFNERILKFTMYGGTFLGSGLVLFLIQRLVDSLLTGEMLLIVDGTLRFLIWISVGIAIFGVLVMVYHIGVYQFNWLPNGPANYFPFTIFFLGFYIGLQQSYLWIDTKLCNPNCEFWEFWILFFIYTLFGIAGYYLIRNAIFTLLKFIHKRLNFFREQTLGFIARATGFGFTLIAWLVMISMFGPGIVDFIWAHTLGAFINLLLFLMVIIPHFIQDIQKKVINPLNATAQDIRADKKFAITLIIGLPFVIAFGGYYGSSINQFTGVISANIIFVCVFLFTLVTPFVITANISLFRFSINSIQIRTLIVGTLSSFMIFFNYILPYHFLTTNVPLILYILTILICLLSPFLIHLFVTLLHNNPQTNFSNRQSKRLHGDKNGFWLSSIFIALIALIGIFVTPFFKAELMVGQFDSELALSNATYLFSFISIITFTVTLAGLLLTIANLWILANQISRSQQQAHPPTRSIQIHINAPLQTVNQGDPQSYPLTINTSSTIETQHPITSFLRPPASITRWQEMGYNFLHEPNLLQQLGQELFQAVFQGKAELMYERERAVAVAKNEILCLEITSQALAPASWPWELLYNPVSNQFVTMENGVTINRYLPTYRQESVSLNLPLRILVIIASPTDAKEYNLPVVNIVEEADVLDYALKPLTKQNLIDIQVLSSSNQGDSNQSLLQKLEKELNSGYDIIHFIGHAGWDEFDKAWVLYFVDGDGDTVSVSATELATVLRPKGNSLSLGFRQSHVPRLIVLNACLTAGGLDKGVAEGLSSILIQAGVPFVVGMQLEVTMESARLFSAAFYTALVESRRVDQAVWVARQELVKTVGLDQADWIAPVLYAQAADYVLFDPV